MLRITIEIVPAGMERHKFDLSNIEIMNDGTSDDFEIGNYDYRLTDDRGDTIERGHFDGFKRNAYGNKGHLRLLERILSEINK